MQQSPSGQLGGEPKEEGPWYVKYGVRGLGTFAGGLAMLLGALNLIFSIFSPTCIIFSIWQMLVGFVVVTIESPCCCVFVEHVQMISERVEQKPMWMKAAVYVAAPLPSIIFCVGFYTVIGGGLILATGVVYGLQSLGKKASREEMSRNAQVEQQQWRGDPSNYQNEPQPQSGNQKSGFTGNISDPIQAAAAQWASQSSNTRTPPPPYSATDNYNKQGHTTVGVGWDTSYMNSTSNLAANNASANPVSANPANPFQ